MELIESAINGKKLNESDIVTVYFNNKKAVTEQGGNNWKEKELVQNLEWLMMQKKVQQLLKV